MRALSIRLVMCGLACLAAVAAAGCGPPDRAEIRYRNMKFISPYATGFYESLAVHDPVAHESGRDSQLARSEMPDLYLRLDGTTVLFLPELTKEQAEEHHLDGGSRPVQFVFYDNEKLYGTIGHLNRKQDPGIEIGSQPGGPFYRFPLTRDQIVELFGPPLDEFARDYPHVN
ncbi:MAG: hypothetical protein WD069_07075 [Planctomycetales bacterium]